jgi:hypothetical protein
MTSTCASCGRPISDHDRQIRYMLPDSLVGHDIEESSDGVWMSHGSPGESVMLQVEGHGAFVRALVPVSLTGGYTATFGVWISVPRADFGRAFEVWWSDELYPSLELDGLLANQIGPWNVLDASVHLEVRDPEHTPYCSSSTDPLMSDVLSDTWPHELVLAAIPS